MNREATRDWNARLGRPRATGQELAVRAEAQHPAALPVGVDHPMAVDPVAFKKSLEVRSQNRNAFVTWVKDALVEGYDYGRIHFKKKKDCALGNACKDPYHFTKDTLFKTGAEKICGMLGVTPTFPNLGRYEEAAVTGVQIHSVILKCQILAANGAVIAEGTGARSLQQENGDLNKALKMGQKSAHIDATLRLAGLSEIFTHPDAPPAPPGPDERIDLSRVPSGRFKGELWADVTQTYLDGVLASSKTPEALKREAREELARRPKAPPLEFDDDIPF
jgi:hypothetical protein